MNSSKNPPNKQQSLKEYRLTVGLTVFLWLVAWGLTLYKSSMSQPVLILFSVAVFGTIIATLISYFRRIRACK